MIYVLLPAHNEDAGLPAVLAKISRLAGALGGPMHIVVVDDGSEPPASTYAAGSSFPMETTFIRFGQNRGVAEAFRAGFTFVCERSRDPENDACVVIEADDTQSPETMVEMLAALRSGWDVVIASRFEGRGGMVGCPWGRRLLSLGASLLMRAAIGLPGVKDYSTFYRAYRVSVLQAARAHHGTKLLDGAGFSAVAGLLIKLAAASSRIREVPQVVRYDRKAGRSGMRIAETTHGYIGLVWRSVVEAAR